MENPFIVTGRIKPEYFCDRVEESQRLVRSILSGGENIVIISPRRRGKTGLINYCFEKPEIKEQVTTISVDILRTSSLQEFTYLLGRARRVTSAQFIKRHHLQSASSVQAAMRKLMEYGIVTTENKEYYVEDQLFHRWLLKR